MDPDRPDQRPRTDAQWLGDAAEQDVADRLIAAGWTIVGRNVHVGRYELDIVAVDPGPPRQLVVVEVRWRADRGFGLPEETVDHRKRARLHRAGFELRDRGSLPDGRAVPGSQLRFDLLVLEPEHKLRHYRHGA